MLVVTWSVRGVRPNDPLHFHPALIYFRQNPIAGNGAIDLPLPTVRTGEPQRRHKSVLRFDQFGERYVLT